jgi:hypothetical protein
MHKLLFVDRVRRLNRLGRRGRAAARPGRGLLELTLVVAFILLTAVPTAEEPPNILNLRAELAWKIVNHLRAELDIGNEVQVLLVRYHPLVFAVEPVDSRRESFRLLMEAGFFSMLDDEELLGALAHEMGHVWIFTHRPFLHTELLANMIAQMVAPRSSLERVYTKLWAYEHTSGVPMQELLGPAPGTSSTEAN